MRNAPALLLSLVVILDLGPSSAASAASGGSAVARRLRERLDAYGRGDAARWASYVDDDCVCAADTKAEIVRAIANRPAGVRNWYGDIADLRVHEYGKTVIVRYRVSEFTEVGGKINTLDEWRTETHVRRWGRWVLVAASDNPIERDPTPIVLPRETLLKFVGSYEYTPGSIDVVTLEGDRLFVQPTAEPKAELFAEGPTTFFAKGQSWRLEFRFASDGTVSAVAFRQSGQEYVGVRLAAAPQR